MKLVQFVDMRRCEATLSNGTGFHIAKMDLGSRTRSINRFESGRRHWFTSKQKLTPIQVNAHPRGHRTQTNAGTGKRSQVWGTTTMQYCFDPTDDWNRVVPGDELGLRNRCP
jgi:hypothetical protein